MIRIIVFAAAFAVAINGTIRADDPTPEEKAIIAAARAKSQNNLKVIALAFHEFHDNNGFCPNNVTDEKGKKLLSWRIRLLPYLDQSDLFNEFKMDEAWDSPHNKKLIALIPSLFRPVMGKAAKGETFYRGFTGPGTIFESGMKIEFRDITDGLSNTILCVEAEKPCPWTKPDDLAFNPKRDALPRVGRTMFEDGFNALYCDGSVRYQKKDLDKEILKGLLTRNGGEVVPFP